MISHHLNRLHLNHARMIFWLALFCASGLIANQKVIDFREWHKPLRPDYLYDLYDAYPEKQERLDSYFKVAQVHNLQPGNKKRVISYSLFMKYAHQEWGEPLVDPETIHKVDDRYHNMSWYDRYAAPLISNLSKVNDYYPGWTIRIYLAKDLAFLYEDVFSHFPGVEVFIMESSSIAYAPGGFWRFLVFDDPNVSYAMVKDADDHFQSEGFFFTWFNDSATKGWFRLRDWGGYQKFENFPYTSMINYHPIVGCGFGWKRDEKTQIQMEKAIKGFIIHREQYLDEPRYYKDMVYPGHPYGFGNFFPNYGIDERFLARVIYYLAADVGQLATIPHEANFPPNHNMSYDNPVLSDAEYIKTHKYKRR